MNYDRVTQAEAELGQACGVQNKFYFTFKIFNLFIHERCTERGRDTGRGRSRPHAGSPEPDAGLYPRTLGLRPGPKAGAKPLSQGFPRGWILKIFWLENCLVDWIGSMRERKESSMILRFFDLSTWMDQMPMNWDDVWAWSQGDQELSLDTFRHIFEHLGSVIHKSVFQGRNLEKQICALDVMKCHLKP